MHICGTGLFVDVKIYGSFMFGSEVNFFMIHTID